MDKIRWGILGCGKIANKFASDLRLVDDAELLAVASRDQEKANKFSQEHGSKLVFNTYEELVACPEVDVIYVATPHGFHHEHVLLCLNHKKAVLCEKAFGLNAREVDEMVATAKNNHVFLMEAFWTKFLPQFGELQKVIQSGEIGALKMIQADFGFRAAVPPPQRLYDPRLGGGALLDIGIYPVFLAVTLLGRPVEVNAVMSPYPSQVDEQIVMNLKFGNDELAVLSASFAADTPVEATIIGTKGYIRMQNRFHNATSRLEVVIGDESREISVERESGHGYQYEARHVGECLRHKLSESPVMTFSDSMLLIETLDRLRRQCGIKYESDNT